ncbi:MAG TPA: DUF305 domain-containing protein [Opitutaceae bacterium]
MTISFFTMYGVMFLNVDRWDHVALSLSRVYMTLLMVSAMAITMLLLMRSMYPSRTANLAILIGSVVVFVGSLVLLRTQTPISDAQYMKAMIPHHSSAIMVSRNATLRDPKTQELAKAIIESQEREIAEMKAALARFETRGSSP